MGQWTNYEKKVRGSLDAVGAYDPVRDIIVIASFRNRLGVLAVDPKNPTGPAVKLTEAGTGPERQGAAGQP